MCYQNVLKKIKETQQTLATRIIYTPVCKIFHHYVNNAHALNILKLTNSALIFKKDSIRFKESYCLMSTFLYTC